MNLHTTQLVRTDCDSCPIRHRAVCSRCEPDELDVLETMKTYKTYDAGQTLVWAGDSVQFLGSVVSGVAALSQTMEDGRRQMVGLLLPSDFVGRPGREIAPFDVVAATEVTVCRFQKAPFEKLLVSTPSIATRLLEMTLDELDSAREWMLLLGRKTAREKIASLLAIIARRDASLRLRKAAGRVQFDLPLSREAMADYLGLTLETVSRQISALKREGIIELQGKRRINIPDYANLLNETGDDTDGGMIV
ncbi:MAG: Crp/Fnr family transcriptional regulator [Rhodobacteraceae bacterium]|nr:Crp/Fnr family transcriptional regulator [Paracoccaceae bacterium]